MKKEKRKNVLKSQKDRSKEVPPPAGIPFTGEDRKRAWIG